MELVGDPGPCQDPIWVRWTDFRTHLISGYPDAFSISSFSLLCSKSSALVKLLSEGLSGPSRRALFLKCTQFCLACELNFKVTWLGISQSGIRICRFGRSMLLTIVGFPESQGWRVESIKRGWNYRPFWYVAVAMPTTGVSSTWNGNHGNDGLLTRIWNRPLISDFDRFPAVLLSHFGNKQT